MAVGTTVAEALVDEVDVGFFVDVVVVECLVEVVEVDFLVDEVEVDFFVDDELAACTICPRTSTTSKCTISMAEGIKKGGPRIVCQCHGVQWPLCQGRQYPMLRDPL